MHIGAKTQLIWIKFLLSIFIIFKSFIAILLIVTDLKNNHCSADLKNEFKPAMISSSLTFFILALIFLVISIKICKRLKEFQIDYFEEHKLKIVIASIGLTLPLFIRSLWYLSISLNTKIHN